jgi:NADH dehydrogenase
VRDPSAVAHAVAGARTVVSAITGFGPARDGSPRSVDWEGNANLIRAAKAAGVEHFVLLSICQAAPDHPIELFRMKHRAEEELRASGLAWTIIRPTAYMETWLGILGAPLIDTGSTRIFGGGKNPINFVSADDVARFVDLAITDQGMRGATIEVGGPANISMNALVETFQSLTGAQGKVGHVPLPMMRVMSAVMKPINPSMAGLVGAAVVMDTRDMTFDSTETRMAYPSIPMTRLADVVQRVYANRSSAPLQPRQGHA